jgi:hypothetical protein
MERILECPQHPGLQHPHGAPLHTGVAGGAHTTNRVLETLHAQSLSCRTKNARKQNGETRLSPVVGRTSDGKLTRARFATTADIFCSVAYIVIIKFRRLSAEIMSRDLADRRETQITVEKYLLQLIS